ncbi:hypothetical protein C5B85_00620 [Pseudoclavibacter sp. AY1F1]|nr:hypothetical protein C5B85_00620 [Pseudoclavibacter sp. AY1F1]
MGLAFVRNRIRHPRPAAGEARAVRIASTDPVLVIAAEIETLVTVMVVAVVLGAFSTLALEALTHRTQIRYRLRLTVCGRTLAGAVIVALRVARL